MLVDLPHQLIYRLLFQVSEFLLVLGQVLLADRYNPLELRTLSEVIQVFNVERVLSLHGDDLIEFVVDQLCQGVTESGAIVGDLLDASDDLVNEPAEMDLAQELVSQFPCPPFGALSLGRMRDHFGVF